MKNIFLKKTRKATSGIILFMLLFSILNPFSNVAFAAGASFTILETQPNVTAVTQIKATRTLTVNSAPSSWSTIQIGTSTITFLDFVWEDNNQLDTIYNTWHIDLSYTSGTEIPRSTDELWAQLRSLINVFSNFHWELALSWASNNAIFTTLSWTEVSATDIPFTDWTSWAISSTNSITWVIAVPAVAQKVNFSIWNFPLQDHLLYKTEINTNNYSVLGSSWDTSVTIATLLNDSMDLDAAVGCIASWSTVTCTSSTPWVSFDFTWSLVDLNDLYSSINAEFTDSTRTALILNPASYTPVSWSAYSWAINSAINLENTSTVTQEQADQAVADIATTKSALVPYTVPGTFSTATGVFISSLSGSVLLSGLDIGWVYSLVYGGDIVSSGVLVATGTTGTLNLQPWYFTTFWNYTLSLSWSNNGSTIPNLDSRWFYIGPVNYEDLFDTVWTTLDSAGIVNNLSGVTNIDVDNFSGLYFEKPGYWKILFNSWMDLTNSWTIAFLQSLPSKLSMTDWFINFDTTNSDFANYWATLFMYFTWSNVPNFSGNSLDYIIAKSSTGALMDDALSGSTLLCAVWVGIPYQVCTFANNHFTSFDFKPYLTDVTISSNNPYTIWSAKNGDRIILDFTWSEALPSLSVAINWTGASSVVDLGSNHYRATSVPITWWSWSAIFSISFMDANWNNWDSVSITTNASMVIIDNDSPTASIAYSNTWVTADDVIATLTWASEWIVVTNNWWLTTYTFTENWSFTFNFRDSVWNTGSTTATVANINNNVPVITLNWSGTINIQNTELYDELGAIWSDLTDGTWTVSILSGSVSIGTLGTYYIDYIKVNSLGLTWSTTRTVNVIDTVAPTVSEVTPVTALTDDNTPNLVISASELSTPSFSGSCNAWTWTNTIWGWNNTITFFTLTDWIHNDCYLTLTDPSGNHSTPLHITPFTVDATAPVITYEQIKDVKDNNVNLDLGFTDANMGGAPYGIVYFTDIWWISTWTVNLAFSWNVASTTITPWWAGLLSNTLYTYTITLRDSLWNTRTSSGDFTTAKIISLNTDITETWPISLWFTGDLMNWGIYELSGSLLMYSDPSDYDSMTWSLTLSWVNIIASIWNWDWVLIPPTLIDLQSSEAATWSEVWAWVTIIQTIKTWSETAWLSATGWYFQVSFMVPWYASWTTFTLYRSQDWNTWTTNTPDAHCTLDAELMCTFETDHLSFFAPWFDTAPDAFSFTAQTDKELSTQYESNTITVTWIDTWATISIVWWEYKLFALTYVTGTWTVNNGDTITVRQTSSASYSTLKTATLTIGWVSANFNVTTKAAPSGGWSSSGGWWSGPVLVRDDCPKWDYSASLYDKICWTKPSLWIWTTSTWTTTSNWNWENPTNNLWDNGDPTIDLWWDTWNWEEGKKFNDIDNSFAKEYIQKLFDMWVIKGYSDGTFWPNKNVSRAEFLSITMKALEIDLSSNWINTFSDVGSWIQKYTIKAKELWIINWQIIDWKSVFRPNEAITRVEALAILFKAAKIDLTSTKTLEFKDKNVQKWMIPYMIKAKEMWIINWQIIDWKLVFRPQDYISRAETAKIIVKFIEMK